jgi:hypothetical protein
MNFFGVHICQDEVFAFMAGLAFVGPAVLWCKTKVWAFRHWRAARRARRASTLSSRKDS